MPYGMMACMKKIHKTTKFIFIFSGFDIRHSMRILQHECFHWNLIFAISLMANSLNLNSAYFYIFRNLSMIAQMIEIQEYKFTLSILNSLTLTFSEPGRQIEFRLYFHPVGYLSITCIKLKFSTIFFLAGHQSFSGMPRTVQ